MTLNEFKAWFDGFTEGMKAAPDADQWARIKARVAEINGAATPYPVFIDRYFEPYRRSWPSVPYWTARDIIGGTSSSCLAAQEKIAAFNPLAAMVDLGKAEYASIAN